MPIRRWVTAQGDKQLSRGIARKHGISPFAAHLLVTRGFTQDDVIQQILNPAGCPLGSPDEFTDMAKAVERIRRAISNYELITVYGDYDVDGITATSLLYTCLEGLGARVQYMLPSRDDGGYGLHLPAIDRMAESGTGLIITVDNGITAIDEIEYAYSKGIEVVITDHHKPLDTLPRAEAILNAHVAGNRCSCTELAGVGVAFKLACALEGDEAEAIRKYSDLVALGTVADAVPITGENRSLVALGLEQLRNAGRTGIRQLIIASGVDASRLSATDISFSLAPRINSAGRLGKPDRVVQLMLSTNVDECRQLAAWLNEENTRRHACEKEISNQAWAALEADPSIADDHVVIISGDGWNSGVVGIFAARLAERVGKPAIVLAIEGDIARGSCRGPKGFSFHKALCECADLLTVFGGHSQAAGFTIETDKIELFRRRINEYAATVDIPVPQLMTDCELPVSCVNLALASGLAPLEPFGTGNPTPLVTIRGAQLRDVRAVGNGGHQRLTLSDGKGQLTAMLFGVDTASFRMRPGDIVDCVVTVGVKTFRGVTSVDAVVRDIRLSSMDCEDIIQGERLFERLRLCQSLEREDYGLLHPSRDETAVVYRYIRASAGLDEPEIICARIGTLPYAKVRTAIEVLRECGLIAIRIIGGRRLISAVPSPAGCELESSPIMKRLISLKGE